MDIKHIYYFEAVYDCGSISKAADRLYMTQQGVSRQIANLERELGTELFNRTSRGVEPTEAGHFLHEHACKILDEQRKIEEHFNDINGRKSTVLRVGISRGLDLFLSDRLYERFSEAHKNVILKISSLWSSAIYDRISDDSLDAGITLAEAGHEDILIDEVMRIPIFCIVNSKNPLADRREVSLDEMIRYKIAIVDENYSSFHNFSKICSEKGVSPDIVEKFDLLSIYEYVNLHEDAVGFTFDIFRSTIKYPDIRCIPITDENAELIVCIAYKEKDDDQDIRSFVSYTKDCIQSFLMSSSRFSAS